jgi:hypothetical protein
MKIKYVRIDDQSIVFEEDGKLFILYNDGVKSERSEYYFHSQFWNGPSPFFSVNIEADSFADVCKKDRNILNMLIEENISHIRNMAMIALNYTDLIEGAKEASDESVENIFFIIKQIKEQE